MTDSALLTLLLQSFSGDNKAYSELLKWLKKHCQSQLCIVLKSYIHFPKELRKDITQEVLVTFHQAHQTFDTTKPFLPWINSIIRHKTIDFLRRKDFRVQMSGTDVELMRETWPNQVRTDPVEFSELIGLMSLLPSNQAQAFKLSKFDGLSNKEISKELKMSESNVKVSIHRAIKFLDINFRLK